MRRLLGAGLGGRVSADILATLGAPPSLPAASEVSPWLIVDASDRPELRAGYHVLRRRAFVALQGLFAHDDHDDHDLDDRTRVLVALSASGEVLGGVRLHPDHDGADAIGWWRGSRLVVDADAVRAGGDRVRGQIGASLVRAACAQALDAGALRFDAHVQAGQERFFARLGWERARAIEVAGTAHVLMRWPIARFAQLAEATKQPLARLVGDLLPRDRWRGDDGVPLAGTGVVSCVDAILPRMVARDPEWAGWCGMLVTAHDLSAMGAAPLGALDALAAPDAAHAERVLAGARAATEVFSLPVLGGHTTLGAPAALSVTGMGTTAAPVPASGGHPGHAVTLTADLAGGWRPGYTGRQWDSTSWRTRDELIPMLDAVALARPAAAKDVSMAGAVGTLGMLAEASGCGAELEVAAIPRPAGAAIGDWLTCFPGFAMLTCDTPEAPAIPAGAAVSQRCGELVTRPGVRLRWPDGDLTDAIGPAVSGLGEAVA
jgi:putative N-acetyltransferase (TIGR04045 family)